jgi:hypothetical protein
MEIQTFTIVTPAFHAERFLDATISSVVSQCGRFRLRYHVQDGGSTDGTVAALKRWTERLQSSLFPRQCDALEFSYGVAPDRGMYDAIQSGFAHCGLEPGSYMTWINADDIVMPGALACVARLFREFPNVQLMGGIPCQIDEEGVLQRIHGEQFYPQTTLAAGLHDGRHLPFVMQEGTFWKAELWQKTGGVRMDLRLAGDFDLWRRFAAETAHVSVDTILAAHRRRAGQLTESAAAYYAELDALMEEHLEQRDQEWERYVEWRARSAADRERSFLGKRLTWESGWWELKEAPLPNQFNTTIYVSASGVRRSAPARFIAGFLEERDPFPHMKAPLGSRWLDGVGVLQFEALGAGTHRLRIRLRNFTDQVTITIKHAGSKLFEGKVPVTLFDRDCEIAADVAFAEGINTVALYLDPPHTGPRYDFLIVACEAEFRGQSTKASITVAG